MAQTRSRRGLSPLLLGTPRSPRFLPSALVALAALLASCGEAGSNAPSLAADPEVPVRVDRVAIDARNTPVVVLEEQGGPRWLPIWIGLAEAESIALEMEDLRPPRPNTHDLARDVIHGLRGRVVRVVVTELRGGTYYALLDVRAGDELLHLDARPSDAIAIALRDGAPIFVRASLFLTAGQEEAAPAPDARVPEPGLEPEPEPELGRSI